MTTDLTQKLQPRIWPVRFRAVSALRAALTGVVGIYPHGNRTVERSLIRQHSLEFRKRPLRAVTLRPFRLLTGFRVASASFGGVLP